MGDMLRPKLGGAVMPLIELAELTQVDYILRAFQNPKPVKLHSQDRLNAIAEMAAGLLKLNGKDEVSAAARALGFNFRKANLERMSQAYLNQKRFGRGIIFQIAPSNTPVSGLYGAIFAFLSGNVVLTRVSPHAIQEITPVVEVIDQIKHAGRPLSHFMSFISYSRDLKDITEAISKRVDGRILWGGDQTIAELKSYSTLPNCIDLAFPDKYSISIFNSDFISNTSLENIKKLSQDFLKDLMTFDQNACSSPKLIMWVGSISSIELAKIKFLSSLDSEINEEKVDWGYASQRAIQAMKIRITGDYSLKMIGSGIINFFKKVNENAAIDFNLFKFGNVLECNLESLNDIASFGSEKLQTCTYAGFDGEDIDKVRTNYHLFGFDRIVPVGKALEMSEIWDGIDFFETLSRKCCVI